MHYEAVGDESSVLYIDCYLLILKIFKCLLSNTINVVHEILSNHIIEQTKFVTEVLLL